MSPNQDLRILLVDDSVGTRTLVKKMLRNLGYSEVETAGDGHEALDLILEDDFDLVISDWIMPKMSGVELVEQLKKNEDTKNIPVLLVTADDDPANIMAALKAGADNYMCKPYDAKVLAEKIEKVFQFKEKKAQRNT